MNIKNLTETMGCDQFYPTPKELAKEILKDIKWNQDMTILEPSAGKGDLIEAVIELSEKQYNRKPDIDCIEIDKNLQHILRGKKYKVIYDDFLSFETCKQYDLILMNPPFAKGDLHLLKALKMQEKGGSVIAILNAETIRNPYSSRRKELLKILETYNADIVFKALSFVSAERKSNVEVAVIKVLIPEIKEESEIYKKLQKAKNAIPLEEIEITDLTLTDYIKTIIKQFEIEVEAGIELIRQYLNLKPYIKRSLTEENFNESILELSIRDHSFTDGNINEYLKCVRYKYWKALFTNPKIMGKLTSSLRYEYYGMVADLSNYDFNEYNIEWILADMNSKISKGIEDSIIDLFDEMSHEHSYYGETSGNIHYYNGWKTNKAHKINKKVILPSHGVFPYNSFSNSYYFELNKAESILSDIEKCLNFLDGHMTREVNLLDQLIQANKAGYYKNIECKYFKVTFYKKGTMHITFTNLDLLEKFNIYAAQYKKWLPPSYGEKSYKEMTEEETAVIDNFQGEKEYEKVCKNAEYFLNSTNTLLGIE